MKYFSIPADFKKETIDEYVRLNTTYKDCKVLETYGNLSIGNMLESGRSIEQIPEIDLLDLQEYVEYSKKNGIEFSYTLNAPHMHNREFTEEGVLQIKKFLSKLYEVGIRNLTICLPSLMEIVQSMDYDFNIKVSVICSITNANKTRVYKDMGAERIVVDESLNKDFAALKRIRDAFGEKVEVIINTICHKDCTYRMFHYNQIAGDSVQVSSDASVNYYSHRCLLRRYSDITNLLKLSWVRPEDLKYYTSIGINYFKLQGRQAVLIGDPVRAVEHYFKEDYDGDLMELLNMFAQLSSFKVAVDNKKLDGFIKPFYEIENFCKNDCAKCNYCESFSKKCIDYDQANEVIELAKDFYGKYDSFTKMIESVDYQDTENMQEDDFAIDFELD